MSDNRKTKATLTEELRVARSAVAELQKRIARCEEAEELFHDFIERSAYGHCRVDIHGRILSANPKAEETLGWESKRLTTMSLRDLLIPEDVERATKNLALTAQSPGSGPTQYRIRTSEGSIRMVEVHSFTMRSKGTIMGFQVTLRDVTQSVSTRLALFRSQERYRILMQHLEDIVYAVDTEGRITFVSNAVRQFGFEPADMIGQSVSDIVIAEDLDRVLPELATTLTEGTAIRTRWRARDSDGTIHFMEDSTAALRNESGTIIGATGILRDVTEQTHAAAALEASEERFRDMANLLPQMVFEVDIKGHLLFVNHVVQELTGYSQAELTGDTFSNLDLVIEKDRPHIAEAMRKAALGKGVSGREHTGRRKDGTTYPIAVYTSPILRDGKAVGLRGIIVDLTDIKQTTAALRKSEARYKNLFQNAPVPLLEINSEAIRKDVTPFLRTAARLLPGRLTAYLSKTAGWLRKIELVDVNDAALRLFKARDRAHMERGFEQIFVTDAISQLVVRLSTMLDGMTMHDIELETRTLDGETKHVHIRWQVAPGFEETWGRMLVSIIDMTAQVEAQHALDKATRELVQAEKLAAIGRMAAGVSHEINQPLTAMRAYSENTLLLVEKKQWDKVRSNVKLTTALLERAATITKQLKTLGAGTQDTVEPVLLQDALRTVLVFLNARAKRDKVRIQRKIPRKPLIVMGSVARFEQVFMNLIGNALDALKRKRQRHITVSLASRDGQAVVTVQDNGPGIPANMLASIFEPFVTTKRSGEAMGLGLSVSLGIIREFGGSITAANAPEGGAVFTITLPLAESTP